MEQTAKKRSNSKTPKKFFLTWENYLRLIDNLAYRIKKSGIKIDYIYGPCRGGYIPAVILSHKFNIPIVKDKLQGNLLFIKEKLAERILELKLEAQRDKFLNPKKKRK